MKQIISLPYKGTDHFQLMEERASIRKKFSSEPRTFKRNQFSKNTTDFYEKEGVMFDYSEEETCVSITFVSPADVYYKENDLLNMTFDQSKNFFLKEDPNIKADDLGFDSKKLGISIYAPNAATDPGSSIESVMIFVEGYL